MRSLSRFIQSLFPSLHFAMCVAPGALNWPLAIVPTRQYALSLTMHSIDPAHTFPTQRISCPKPTGSLPVCFARRPSSFARPRWRRHRSSDGTYPARRPRNLGPWRRGARCLSCRCDVACFRRRCRRDPFSCALSAPIARVLSALLRAVAPAAAPVAARGKLARSVALHLSPPRISAPSSSVCRNLPGCRRGGGTVSVSAMRFGCRQRAYTAPTDPGVCACSLRVCGKQSVGQEGCLRVWSLLGGAGARIVGVIKILGAHWMDTMQGA
ncbi:hypothetical protein C8R47DRAFT_290466 [Mycena vitilis]|nr:hypothetical protein C8R47DRAFT_290466 [Mycena vitilis]